MCIVITTSYQDVWETVIEEQLECTQEPENLHNRYAVAILREEIVVGHVQRKTTICVAHLKSGKL